jgi:hypothetical protein
MFKAALSKYGQTSYTVPGGLNEDCKKTVEVYKAVQGAKGVEFVMAAGRMPILYSYQSDGTPFKVREQTVVRTDAGTCHSRGGGRVEEYLMERAFYKKLGQGSLPEVTGIFHEPRALAAGRGFWHLFDAMEKYQPRLKQLGHKGH